MPLVDSTKWKAAEVPISQLRFLPDNPRLTEVQTPRSESQIIEELCDQSGIDDLATKIAEVGYLRTERLIVVVESGQHMVYEGNRRLCALRLLNNPSLAPTSKKSFFQKLSDKADIPRKIHVEIVPSRYDAEVVMFAKHAQESFSKGWNPLQQANWIAGQLQAGRSKEDLENMGVSPGDLETAYAAVDFFRLCRVAPGAGADRIRKDPRVFPYSVVFERLIKPKAARAALGIEFAEKGLAVPSDPAFMQTLERILDAAVVTNTIDTRVLGAEAAQLAYVKSLNYSPPASPRASVHQITAAAASSFQPPTPQPPATPPPSKKRSAVLSARLIPQNVVCEYPHRKLKDLLQEGKGLIVEDFPMASALALRCLVELALQNFLKEKGELPALAKRHSKDPAYVAVGKILEDIRNGTIASLDLTTDEKKALGPLVKQTGMMSYESLHLFVHNPHWTATTQQVALLRDALLPVLRKTLLK